MPVWSGSAVLKCYERKKIQAQWKHQHQLLSLHLLGGGDIIVIIIIVIIYRRYHHDRGMAWSSDASAYIPVMYRRVVSARTRVTDGTDEMILLYVVVCHVAALTCLAIYLPPPYPALYYLHMSTLSCT